MIKKKNTFLYPHGKVHKLKAETETDKYRKVKLQSAAEGGWER